MSDRAALQISRRSFLEKGGLLAGAAMFLSPWQKSYGTSVPSVQLTDIEQAILQFLGSYSSNCFWQGGCTVGKLDASPFQFANIVVQVISLSSEQTAWRRHPFSGVYGRGNTVAFFQGGTFVTLEHLLPADFQQRLTDLAAGKNTSYAHEAVVYNPSTRALSDPLSALRRIPSVIKLVNPATTQGASFAQLLRGILDQRYYNLASDSAFASFQRSLLSQRPASTDAAGQIASRFLILVSALAGALPTTTVSSLLTSPLVASSFASARGISASNAVNAFNGLRAQVDPTYSNAAIWLVALLSEEINNQNVLPSASDDPFAFLQARMALLQARKIIDSA
jgi:hypothetical protein